VTHIEPFLDKRCFENLHITSFSFYTSLTHSGIILKAGDFMLQSGLPRKKFGLFMQSTGMVASGNKK